MEDEEHLLGTVMRFDVCVGSDVGHCTTCCEGETVPFSEGVGELVGALQVGAKDGDTEGLCVGVREGECDG